MHSKVRTDCHVQGCRLAGYKLGVTPAAGVAERVPVRDVVTKLQREVVLVKIGATYCG